MANSIKLMLEQLKKMNDINAMENMEKNAGGTNVHDIAVIGLATMLPGADNYHQFWDNLVAAKE